MCHLMILWSNCHWHCKKNYQREELKSVKDDIVSQTKSVKKKKNNGIDVKPIENIFQHNFKSNAKPTTELYP